MRLSMRKRPSVDVDYDCHDIDYDLLDIDYDLLDIDRTLNPKL